MRTCSIYWWIFLILQLLPLHNACGYADSIRLESIAVEVGEGASISIFAALSHQFGGFEIPLASSSVDLVFDSVSLVGTIAEEKLRAGFWLKENPNRIIINLFPHSLFELEPVLPPGGRLCEVYFHIRPDAFSGLVEIDTLSDTINLLPDTLQFRPLRGWDSKGENELPLDFIPGLILVTYPTDALNIYEEGLRIPPTRIYKKGQWQSDIWRIIESNSRAPDQVLGDMQAQIAGCRFAQKQVAELLATRWVSTIQVYGEASAEALDRLAWEGYRTLLPVTVQDAGFAANPPDALRNAAGTSVAAVVLDAHEPGKLGGTGKTFGWPWVNQARKRGELDRWPPILLAGGLTPDNVAQAIVEARPYGVDVSSGVESSPGRKDPDKVRRFVMEARRAAETI